MDNATVNEYTSSEEFEHACLKSKAIIVIGNKDMTATIPSKMLEAIGLKKPIIGLNFSNALYYINKYPFYFDADNNSDVLLRIEQIDCRDMNLFNIYRTFPERNPKQFVKLLVDSIKA